MRARTWCFSLSPPPPPPPKMKIKTLDPPLVAFHGVLNSLSIFLFFPLLFQEIILPSSFLLAISTISPTPPMDPTTRTTPIKTGLWRLRKGEHVLMVLRPLWTSGTKCLYCVSNLSNLGLKGQNVSTVSQICLILVSNCLKRSQFCLKHVSDKMSQFGLNLRPFWHSLRANWDIFLDLGS